MAQFLLFVAVVLGLAAIVRRSAMALELLPTLHPDRSLWFVVAA